MNYTCGQAFRKTLHVLSNPNTCTVPCGNVSLVTRQYLGRTPAQESVPTFTCSSYDLSASVPLLEGTPHKGRTTTVRRQTSARNTYSLIVGRSEKSDAYITIMYVSPITGLGYVLPGAPDTHTVCLFQQSKYDPHPLSCSLKLRSDTPN